MCQLPFGVALHDEQIDNIVDHRKQHEQRRARNLEDTLAQKALPPCAWLAIFVDHPQVHQPLPDGLAVVLGRHIAGQQNHGDERANQHQYRLVLRSGFQIEHARTEGVQAAQPGHQHIINRVRRQIGRASCRERV